MRSNNATMPEEKVESFGQSELNAETVLIPITVMRGNEKLTFTVEAGFHPASQNPPVIASPLSPQAMPLGLDRTP